MNVNFSINQSISYPLGRGHVAVGVGHGTPGKKPVEPRERPCVHLNGADGPLFPGNDLDNDVDIAVLVSDLVLGGKELPKVGEGVSATIRLQGRVRSPNVR